MGVREWEDWRFFLGAGVEKGERGRNGCVSLTLKRGSPKRKGVP